MSEVNDFLLSSILLPLPLVCPTASSQEATKAVALGCSDFASGSLTQERLKSSPRPSSPPGPLSGGLLSWQVSSLESFGQLTSVSGQVSFHTGHSQPSPGCVPWPCLPGLLLPTLPFKLLLKHLSPHSKPPLVLLPLSALRPASYSSPVLPPPGTACRVLELFNSALQYEVPASKSDSFAHFLLLLSQTVPGLRGC